VTLIGHFFVVLLDEGGYFILVAEGACINADGFRRVERHLAELLHIAVVCGFGGRNILLEHCNYLFVGHYGDIAFKLCALILGQRGDICLYIIDGYLGVLVAREGDAGQYIGVLVSFLRGDHFACVGKLYIFAGQSRGVCYRATH